MSNASRTSVDLATKPLTTISRHESIISSIAYLPGGERVVSCSDDKTVRIWDVENGEQEGKSIEHEGCVHVLAVTRDGKRILGGGVDGRMKVWDAETHELIEEWELKSHERGICSIALSPNDELVGYGDGQGKIIIREIKENEEIKHSIEAGSSMTLVYSVCFSPNGEKLACAVNELSPDSPDSPGVQPDIGDYAIKVYDVESGELILGPIKGHEDWVCCVLPIGEPWTGHTDQVTSLKLSSDGTILTSASIDRTVRFWDPHSGIPIGQPLHLNRNSNTSAFALSPSNKFVALGGSDGMISIWCVPCWDNNQKEPHQSFLDLPAVPIFMSPSNDQQQSGLNFLNCLWCGLISHCSSAPPQQAIDLQPNQDRRLWKFSVGTPLTEVVAGHAKNGVVVGRSVPRRKKKRHHKSHKTQEPQAPTAAEAGPLSHAEASTSNASPSTSQTGPTASNAAPTGRASSFTQSTMGSDNSWDDMDCSKQCVDYICFGPRENCERFRPWKKKLRAVIEAEERAKKGKKKKDTPKRRKSTKALKTHDAVHCLDPQRDHIRGVSPVSQHAVDVTLECPGNHGRPDGVVPQVVLPLEEQIEQLRRQLDASVAANRKADAERDLLQKEVMALRSSGYSSSLPQDPHTHTGLSTLEAHPSTSLGHPSCTCSTSNGGSSASQTQTWNIVCPPCQHDTQGDPNDLKIVSPTSHDAADVTGKLVRDDQLDGTVHLFALQLQAQMDQLRQQFDDLVAAKGKAGGERDLLEMGVKDSRKPQEYTGLSIAEGIPSPSHAEATGSMSTAGPSTQQAGPSTSS
ncbi:WD40 repeat-like protein [Paxillus ammoniavirescens]|nr:WD40 repeat-like protein [Paxillus ammoniavirescens]